MGYENDQAGVRASIDGAILMLKQADRTVEVNDFAETIEALKAAGDFMASAWRLMGWWQANSAREKGEAELTVRREMRQFGMEWSDRSVKTTIEALPRQMLYIIMDHSYDRDNLCMDVLNNAKEIDVKVLRACEKAARKYLDQTYPGWLEYTIHELTTDQEREFLGLMSNVISEVLECTCKQSATM